jgi:hypothetical protein
MIFDNKFNESEYSYSQNIMIADYDWLLAFDRVLPFIVYI